MAMNITTHRPRLDITTTNARLDITNRIRRMSASRTAPKMTVERTNPSFKVDWSRVWSESGRRTPSNLSGYVRQQSASKVQRAIQRTVQTGDQMKDIQNYQGSKTPIGADLAWRHMMEDGQVETNISSMPHSKPNVTWDPGSIKIDWSTGEVHIEWDDDYMPDVSFTPHSVEIRLTGRSGVDISVDESNVMPLSGRRINKNA